MIPSEEISSTWKRAKTATGAKDFTAELLAMKNAGAQVLVFYGHEEATALLQRQIRQLGSPFKFLGSPSAASKDSLNLAKEAAEGIWAVVDFVPGQSEENRRYAEAYKKEYNEEYDTLEVSIVQIEKGKPKLLKIVNLGKK